MYGKQTADTLRVTEPLTGPFFHMSGSLCVAVSRPEHVPDGWSINHTHSVADFGLKCDGSDETDDLQRVIDAIHDDADGRDVRIDARGVMARHVRFDFHKSTLDMRPKVEG